MKTNYVSFFNFYLKRKTIPRIAKSIIDRIYKNTKN